jgi:NAD(P)-dependent dehydrogenase (short-subunit alcohol dehydrogenase family)
MLDVTDEATIETAMQTVKASGVPLIGIVSNAGIALGGPLEHLPTAQLRRQFDVNVLGAMAFVRLGLPHLEPHGRVVFVGSISGRLATPYLGPYSASKFALRALSDALRLELAPAGIAVALIEPGAVKTPIWRKGGESRERLAELLGTHARPHYYRVLEGMSQRMKETEHLGISAEVVAQAILHALTARKPRARYLLGSAKPASIVALLPVRLRDRILSARRR